MITDFCMSLSRLAQDKVNGTGRFFIMKNRYGMDGMTYYAEIDASTGHVKMSDAPKDYDSIEQSNNSTALNEPSVRDRKSLAPLAENFFMTK